jgi:hypothetical protein
MIKINHKNLLTMAINPTPELRPIISRLSVAGAGYFFVIGE